jgi:hypothetical protein
VGALGGRWGLPGPAAEELRETGRRVRAAGAVDSLRIKEVNDDAQDFRMQLAQQAIDFRSEPPMEGHCNGNVASSEEGPQIVLSISDPGRIGTKIEFDRPLVWSKRAIRLDMQPGKLWTGIPRIPKNAIDSSTVDELTMDAVSKSWIKRPEHLLQKFGKSSSEEYNWRTPPISWHLGLTIAIVV